MITPVDGIACLSSTDASIMQDVLVVGKYYKAIFNVESIDGQIFVYGIDHGQSIEQLSSIGEHIVEGYALTTQFTIQLENGTSACLSNVSCIEMLFWKVVDKNNTVIKEMLLPIEGTIYNQNIQYQIDWSGVEGIVQIQIQDGIVLWKSNWLNVQPTHECTLLLTWNNNENAFGFEGGILFTPSLRLDAKLRFPKYSRDKKEVFTDSQGNRKILFSRQSKVEKLQVQEVPEYIHDAISVGLENDNFYINFTKYVYEADEYEPSWRKTSTLAPIELDVIRQNQSLVNDNCL
jgi:hypothetical protein